MKTTLRYFLTLCLALGAMASTAMPAHPGRHKITLPDGTVREVIMRGDERGHWLETPEGERLTERVSSLPELHPTPQQIADISQKLRSKRGIKQKANSSLLIDGCFPPIGKHKLLAVLVNFKDTKPACSREDFDNMMNQEGYRGIGSFRDYYLQQSYGQLDITTTVTRWVTVSQNHDFYAGNYVTNLIAEALTQLDGEINFADYDNDGDGVVDGLIVIHQGGGQEATSNPNDIWSHSSVIYGMQYDGVSIYRYTIEPELYTDRASKASRQTGIGVVTHEFGHNLGASDYYDSNYETGGSYGGTGRWDLMGSGAWNGPVWRSSECGDAPAPITAWQKIQFGWMTPTILNGSTEVRQMPDIATQPVCYQMNTSVAGDYFILENHQMTSPWEAYTPGKGLVLTHAIESVIRQRLSTNTINATYPQGLYTVDAHAGKDPVENSPSSYGNINEGSACFPGTRDHSTFSDETQPSCRSYGGRRSYNALTNIEEMSGQIAFDYIEYVAPQKPENFTATVLRGVVTLTWTFPEEKERPLYFTIYRDGTAIQQTTELQYVDTEATTTGTITYTIDATYASGLISSYQTATTRIPTNKATNLTYTTTQDNQLVLNWEQPKTLTRCVDDLNYNTIDHITNDFRYAHRFRAEDLLPYIGYKVRGVTFIPNQPSTTATFDVCVWRAEPGAKEGTLVASRNVKEFSPTYKKTTLLTVQPTIEAGYEYWIGVQITSTNNAANVIMDQSELISGYGNWMSVGGTAWQSDPMATGNYILAATLTAPTSAVISQEIPIYQDIDTDIDLYYPLGYNVYEDNDLKGTTTATSFSLPCPGDAQKHTYSVVSLYKCENESQPLSIEVTDPTGITTVQYQTPDNHGLYDLQGRQLQQGGGRGLYIQNGQKVMRL